MGSAGEKQRKISDSVRGGKKAKGEQWVRGADDDQKGQKRGDWQKKNCLVARRSSSNFANKGGSGASNLQTYRRSKRHNYQRTVIGYFKKILRFPGRSARSVVDSSTKLAL